jgi:WD40-like Beta Propeller Repeat
VPPPTLRIPLVAVAFVFAVIALALVALAPHRRAAPPPLNRNVVSSLWSVPVDGGAPRTLLRDPHHQDAFPLYRRDGTLLFARPTLSSAALFSLRAGHVTRLRALPVFAPPAYSPALDELALPRGRTIAAETLDGRVARRLARVPSTTIPSWSADGTTLVYSQTVRTPANRYQSALIVVRSGRARVLPVRAAATELAVSPAGDRVLFVLGRRLMLLDLATRRRRVVARGGSWPAWSPNGRTVAFCDRRGVVLLDLRTGRRTRGPAQAAGAAFSPDGRSLVYVRLYAAQSMPK